jgi:hypothetical protein
MEYHATMESCSDTFQIDIPNVVWARACCAYRARMARCPIRIFVLMVAIVFSFREEEALRITITVIVITL